MDIAGLFFFFILLAQITIGQGQGLRSLSPGRGLSAVNENDFLVSPKGTFASGFYKVGTNAYCYAIWFTQSIDRTVVWMANRDSPVNGQQSQLRFHKDGNLVLTDADGSTVWSTNTLTEPGAEVRLLETGNLVLINQAQRIIWESFGFPTDTLLPWQPLTKNTTLVSMRSRGTYLTGFYNLKFDDNNILNLIYNGPQLSSVYWPSTSANVFASGRTPYNSTRMAILDGNGQFTSSDNLNFKASDYGIGPKRRLTLDYDGTLRLYSLERSTGRWELSWQPPGLDSCQVHLLCGENAICSSYPRGTCRCPNGFYRNDHSDWSKGCSPSFNLTCNPAELEFMELQRTDYYGYDLESYSTNVTLEQCRNSCLNDCRCKGFGYALDGQGQCFPKSSLLNGFSLPDTRITMHIKVRKGMGISSRPIKTDELNCSAAEVVLNNNSARDRTKKDEYMKYLIGFVSAAGLIELILILLASCYIFRNRVQDELANMGYIALALGFKRFNYAELKKATKNFKQEIGKGGFGTVYKGTLDDEREVAVKRLEGVLQGDAEFWAEVSIIGKINHRNLVKLWGFCAEKEHKLLVYEFVENGSLDKLLFSNSDSALGWDQRYNIALGTAKGLSYLHEECLEWVLHCDVKAQNILLDDQFEPKVADFGMSMLFKESHEVSGFSKVRGTRGYLAPEWMMNLKIDAKADVYSYGVVLLELLTGKSASGFQSVTMQDNECSHLVQWVTQKLKQEGPEGICDPRLEGEHDKEQFGRMVQVAMLCLGEDHETRPAMSKVVELLV